MILLEFLVFLVALGAGGLALLRLDFAKPFMRVVPVGVVILVMALAVWIVLRILRRRWQRRIGSWAKELFFLALLLAVTAGVLHALVPGFLPVALQVYRGPEAAVRLRALAGSSVKGEARWARAALALRRESIEAPKEARPAPTNNGGELAPPSPDELGEGAAPPAVPPGPVDEARQRLLAGAGAALAFLVVVVIWALRVAGNATRAAQRIFGRHQKLIEQIIPQTEAVEKAFFCSELRPSRGGERTPELVPKDLLGIWTARRLILLTDYRESLRRPNMRQVPLREIEDVESRERPFTFAGRALTLFLRSGDQIVLHLWSSEMAREVETGLREAIRKSISLTDPDWRPTDTTGEHVKGLCHSCFNTYTLPIFEPPDCPSCGARLGVKTRSRIASLLRVAFWACALGALLAWKFLYVELGGVAVGKDKEILLLVGTKIHRFDGEGKVLAVPATWPRKTPPRFVHADLRGRFHVGSADAVALQEEGRYRVVFEAASGERLLAMDSDAGGRHWILFEKTVEGVSRPGVIRLDGRYARLRAFHPLLGPSGEAIEAVDEVSGIPGGFLAVCDDGRLLRYDGKGDCQGSLYAGVLPPVAAIEARGKTGLVLLGLSKRSRLGLFGTGDDAVALVDLKDTKAPAEKRLDLPPSFLPAMTASISPMGRLRPTRIAVMGDDVLLVDGWAYRLDLLVGGDWKTTRLLAGGGLMGVLDGAKLRARVFTALTALVLMLLFMRLALHALTRGAG